MQMDETNGKVYLFQMDNLERDTKLEGCKAGVGNLRPAGRIRSAEQYNPARDASLDYSNKTAVLTIIFFT